MTLPAQNYMSSGRTEAEMKAAFEDQRDAIAATPGGAPSVELTIAAGSITPTVTAGDFRIDTEVDAAADDLTNIQQTNSWETRRIRLRCENAARVTTLKHASGGSGQILMIDSADFLLNDTGRWVDLEDVGSDWIERARSYGADYVGFQDSQKIAQCIAGNILCPHTRLSLAPSTISAQVASAEAVVLYDAAGHARRFNALSDTVNIANTGANGRDVIDNGGLEQASVWYHLFAIGKNDGTLDTFASQVGYPGSPTSIFTRLPSGYVWAGYLGAVYNDAGSNLVAIYQRGARVIQNTVTVLSAGAATATTAVSLAAAIPQTAQTVDLNVYTYNPGGTGDAVAFIMPLSGFSARQVFHDSGAAANIDFQIPVTVPLMTAQEIYYANNLGTVRTSLFVIGWEF